MDADNAVAQATAVPPADRHTVSTVEPGQFFREHYRALVKTVMWLRGAPLAEAEEAVSQAMSAALPRWCEIANPRAYVLRAALNAHSKEREVLPRIRARQVERRDGTPEFADDPRLNSWEDRQWVRQLLSGLAPAQFEVMAAVVDELQPTEIAELLGRSPEAVRSSLADARKRLKQKIRDEQVADSNGTPRREGPMTTDDPTAQPNETEQAAAELREVFDLIDETVDAITDDEIEQRWLTVRDRSRLDVGDRTELNVGNLVNKSVDAVTDDAGERGWHAVLDDRGFLRGIRDGQRRAGGGTRGWSAWRESVPSRATEAAALDAMRDAAREHLRAVECRLMAAKAELQAAEVRAELAWLREQEAVARAERAEQEAARAKEQAEKDAATAADALADAALERSQEIIKGAHEQAADLLAGARRQAAEVIAAAEGNTVRRRRAEPVVSSDQGSGRRQPAVGEGIELAGNAWAASPAAVVCGEWQLRKSAIVVAFRHALVVDAVPADIWEHASALVSEQGSALPTLMGAGIRPPGPRRWWAAMVQRVRRCMGFTELGDATGGATDIRFGYARGDAASPAGELETCVARWDLDCSGRDPAADLATWRFEVPRAAGRRRPIYVLISRANGHTVVQVPGLQQERTATAPWSGLVGAEVRPTASR